MAPQKVLGKNEASLTATQLSSDVLLGLPSRFNLTSFMKQSNLDVALGSWHYFKASNAGWKMMKPSLIGSWHCSLSLNLWNLDILITSRWFLGEEPLECKPFDATNSGAWCINGECLEVCDSDPLKTNEKKTSVRIIYPSRTGLDIFKLLELITPHQPNPWTH